MKKAFVNCWIMPGGVLNVLETLILEEEYSQAKLFTLFSDRQEFIIGEKKIQIVTALPQWLNKWFLYCSKNHIKFISSIFDYRNLMMFYPFFMRILSLKIKKYKPEKIIISSFAIAKNISVNGIYKKLYLHSPMQYIWSHYEEYSQKMKGFKGFLFKFITPRLRKRDKKFTQFNEVEFNSEYTKKLAGELYGINGKVVYPQIDKTFLSVNVNLQPNNYYIYVGRIVRFVKELDKIIKMFNEVKQPLLIMGSGPDEIYLKSIAGDNIIFIGWINDPNEKMNIIRNSKGLINITKESFGICTMEALLCGVPVFGFNDGGSIELVDENSGILVDNKHHHTLVSSFEKFIQTDRDREKIQNRAKEMMKY